MIEKKMVFRKKLFLEYWEKFGVSTMDMDLLWADECEGMTFDETKRKTNNITVSAWFSEEETENEKGEKMKYRKKPVVIEAVEFQDTYECVEELQQLGLEPTRISYKEKDKPVLIIETLEGDMKASLGDYVIKGINGEFYPCKPDIFDKTYEKVSLEGEK